jgi:hypothetical protein
MELMQNGVHRLLLSKKYACHLAAPQLLNLSPFSSFHNGLQNEGAFCQVPAVGALASSPTHLMHALHSWLADAGIYSKWKFSPSAPIQTLAEGALLKEQISCTLAMSGLGHNAVLQHERRATSGGNFPMMKLAGSCQGLHVPGGRRQFHACAVYASAAKADGQLCILKIVDEMIHYCNACRSKGEPSSSPSIAFSPSARKQIQSLLRRMYHQKFPIAKILLARKMSGSKAACLPQSWSFKVHTFHMFFSC